MTPPVARRALFPSRRASVWLALFALLFSGLACGKAWEVSRESQLKAAFVYNFTKFIEWPPQRFPDAHSPIVIGVFGRTPLRDELEKVARDHTVNGRAIVVKQVESVEQARDAHLLFVSADESESFAGLEAALLSSPVVTVGESPIFAASGGIINFVLDDDKVRFEINMASAERAGVQISAQLQKLAILIRRNR